MGLIDTGTGDLMLITCLMRFFTAFLALLVVTDIFEVLSL